MAAYPEPDLSLTDPAAEEEMAVLIEATRALRNFRAELGIAPGMRLQALAVPSAERARVALTANTGLIAQLARLSAFDLASAAPSPESGKWIGTPVTGAEVFLEIGDAMDIDKELARIDKELAEIEKQVARADGMLGNPGFTEKAPAEKIQQERDRLTAWREKQAKLEERRKLFAG